MTISLKIFFTLLMLAVSTTAYSLDACATSSESDGETNLSVNTDLETSDLVGGVPSAWRTVASAVQELYGNRVAFDNIGPDGTAQVYLQVTGRPFALAPRVRIWGGSIQYDGSTSIEKAVLSHVNIDNDQPDPSPCDPDKNEDNSTAGASSGGSGGGGGGSASTSGGGSVIGQLCATFGCKIPTTSVRED